LLQATSEDNVLYTAQKYVDNITDPQQKHAAAQKLAPLIRCPHLSPFWLSDDAPKLLLNQLSKQVGKLIMAHQGQLAQPVTDPPKLVLRDAPASWALDKRASKAPSSVQVTWKLEVSKLCQAAQDSARQQERAVLDCPTVSPPLGGIEWHSWMMIDWDAGKKGTRIGFFTAPRNLPAGMCIHFAFNLQATGLSKFTKSPPFGPDCPDWGWLDVFGLGSLPSGWDEAAWASKGLPATGQLDLTLTITSVSNSSS